MISLILFRIEFSTNFFNSLAQELPQFIWDCCKHVAASVFLDGHYLLLLSPWKGKNFVQKISS